MIESIHQDINTANHKNMIRRTTMHENINHRNINHAIISINQITGANRFLLLSFISIQYHKTTLTEIRDHLLIQINLQTTTNINHDLIYSEMIYQLLIRFVRTELRNLRNFRLDRMNSIKETKNTRTRLIMQRWVNQIWNRNILMKTNMRRNMHKRIEIRIWTFQSISLSMMNKTTNFTTKKSRLNQRINMKHSQNLLKLKLSALSAKRCSHSKTSFTSISRWVAKRWNLLNFITRNSWNLQRFWMQKRLLWRNQS